MLTIVFPLELDSDPSDEEEALDHGESGFTCMGCVSYFEPECAFCQFGCCSQRYRIGVMDDEPVVVHGALGVA